jgi:hypothetical protein
MPGDHFKQVLNMKDHATRNAEASRLASMRRIAPAISSLSALVALATLALAPAHAHAAGVDPDAAGILKHMTDYVGKLQRFSVDTAATVEVVLVSGQKLQFTSAARTTLQRPDKLRSERIGDVISQSFYYDGRTFTIFNPGDGYFAAVPAPNTIDAMVDFARDSLDVVAPASDLLTMDAYDRLTTDATSGFVVGKSAVGGVRCDHLAFRSGVVDWQVWIEDGNRPLPRKFVITSLDVDQAPQFEVMMSNWSIDPSVDAKYFQFTPPPGAKAIEFLPAGTAGAQP